MMNLLRLMLVLGAFLLISACASLSKSECDAGDWGKIGSKDGANGLLAEKQLNKHRSACAKHQKTPNREVYFSGHKEGLKRFCVNKVGFNHGFSGSEYFANCPASLEKQFLTGYIPGLEAAIDDLAYEIQELRHKRHRTNRRLDALYHVKKKPKDHKKRIGILNSRLSIAKTHIFSKRDEVAKLRAWRSFSLSRLSQLAK